MDTKELLVEAKNKILNDGWTQGDYGDTDKGYCAAGAIDAVTSDLLKIDAIDEDEATEMFNEGYRVLRDTLKDSGGIANVVGWNDASHRSVNEVLDLFDAAAQRVGGE